MLQFDTFGKPIIKHEGMRERIGAPSGKPTEWRILESKSFLRCIKSGE